jgi:hypothetical protein
VKPRPLSEGGSPSAKRRDTLRLPNIDQLALAGEIAVIVFIVFTFWWLVRG